MDCADIDIHLQAIELVKEHIENYAEQDNKDPWNENGGVCGEFATHDDDLYRGFGLDYLNLRMCHAFACRHISDLGNAIAIECFLDVLELEQFAYIPIMVDALFETVQLLIEQMEDFSRAYTLLKSYARKGTCNFLNKKRYYPGSVFRPESEYEEGDLSESTSELDLMHHALNTKAIFCMSICKLWLYNNVRNLKVIGANVLQNFDCTSKVGEFLGIPPQWWSDNVDATVYHRQAKECLSAWYGYDKMKGSQFDFEEERDNSCFAYLPYFLNHVETERIDLPINRNLEMRRLEMNFVHFKHIGSGDFSTKLTACQLMAERNINSCYLKFQRRMEMLMAQSYFHLHKYSSSVKALFAQMGKDSTKVQPRRFDLGGYYNGEPVFTDVARIVKALKRNGLCSTANLELCFKNAGYAILFGQKGVDYD
eukprot:CAMPEP_0194117044 /NCGR_PEP_ID=MMETSP0150-20130528/29492_1 /TAXON_ID=122233 /ORGANISM="Chaetoceros debilis, Strain MM31A-1" /LENGTH=423 /DNA_ID=CAMNT_0038807919 /DNA_START=307 /DNA_END=1578 /DNA_ORIENTATION=+